MITGLVSMQFRTLFARTSCSGEYIDQCSTLCFAVGGSEKSSISVMVKLHSIF